MEPDIEGKVEDGAAAPINLGWENRSVELLFIFGCLLIYKSSQSVSVSIC
jgi:hypothetical protein